MTVKLRTYNAGDWEKGVYRVSTDDTDACIKILIAGDLCPIGRVENLLLSGQSYDAKSL